MKKLFLLTTFVFLTQALFAQNAKEIIRKAEDAMRGNTQVSLMTITIKNPRWTRQMEMKSWDDRLGKRSFSEVIAPKKDAGNRFLLIDKNMTHFIPKLQQEIKISPSMMLQSWMGSDFTNDDIVKESSILDDYTHSIAGKDKIDGYECWKIELKPKQNAAVVWGKIIYFARVTDSLPVKNEFYNEHGVMKKVMTFTNFKKMHDRVIPTVYKMKTVGKEEDRYTLMEIKNIQFNIPISNRIFAIQNLKRK
jgi:outer membrane lipoprotein-sorting protein